MKIRSRSLWRRNHNLSVGDVNGDGFDEIIMGAAALKHDGTLLYRTGFGHGDAMHLSDMDPDKAGLEVWSVHENKASAYGYELRGPTGSVIFGKKTGLIMVAVLLPILILHIVGLKCGALPMLVFLM